MVLRVLKYCQRDITSIYDSVKIRAFRWMLWDSAETLKVSVSYQKISKLLIL